MDEIVPEVCKVFRLEDGLMPVVAWLDVQVGNTEGPREIGMFNSLKQRVERSGRATPSICVTDRERDFIGLHYRRDFERFGYRADDLKEGYP